MTSFDTATGNMVNPPGSNGAGNSYDIFSQNLMALLSQAQKVGDPSALMKSREQMINQSLNLSNPMNSTPYKNLFGMMNPTQSLAAQNGTQSAFQPGLTSITDQMNAANQGLTSFQNTIKTAHDINAPQELPLGSSLVTQTGETLNSGFNPTINPETGYPYGYNRPGGQSTGQMLVGGTDFSGAATSTEPYATDPNYSHAVGGIYDTLKNSIPQPNPQVLDQYIKGHATKSPVTGQMIMNAASQYGIDPLVLTSVLAQESDFGTAGAATSTMNAGNVGNTGTSTKSFQSWQAGVSAAAYEIAKRTPGNKFAGGSTVQTSGGTTSNVGGAFSPEATEKIQQLPKYMQNFVSAGPKGVAYIDSTKLSQLPAGTQGAVQNISAKAGIPWLDTQDVSNIKAMGVVYENVQKMQELVKDTLNHGFVGGLVDMAKTKINDLTNQNAFPDLAKFNAYRDVAIKAVQALAGGNGSGLRLTTGEIMASTATLADSGNSIETANNKISGLLSLLNTNLATNFPYTQGGQPGAHGDNSVGGGFNSSSQAILDKYGIR